MTQKPSHEHSARETMSNDAASAGDAPSQGHSSHHAHMVADFRRRFWVSLILSVPVLALAPLIQKLLGVEEAWSFRGDSLVQFAFATVIFFYGGQPFLTGLRQELKQKPNC